MARVVGDGTIIIVYRYICVYVDIYTFVYMGSTLSEQELLGWHFLL